MADKRDYYEVLGVSKTATDADIKKAFRTVAKKYHPDMNPGDADAEAKFKEAQEAYAVLSDPEKRKQYDQFGHAAFDGTGGAGGFDFSNMDMGDIFGDIFGDFFGGGSRRRANDGPMKGQNLRTSVRITFEEAVFGCEKEIEMVLKDECKTCHGTGAKPGTSPETCPKCGGKGKVVFTQQSFFGTVQNVQTCPDCGGSGKIVREKCPDCRGTGYIASKKKIQVSIPAGIDNGQSVRIREKGEPGINGGPRGDLLVEVTVSRHPVFQRQDMNIYSTAPITYAQAALGGEIRINTVDGDVLYEVKPGTQTDTRIRLKGKGVPSLRNKAVRGDHYVTLVVQVPTGLSSEAKELLRQFDEETGGSLNRANSQDGSASAEKHKKKKGFMDKAMDKIKESLDDI
ncbi:MAG: molecular chaperone DnaJ [Roseburia sp.]|nr:molecular chaperone DnaJ [Roseburia sp.]